MPHLLAEAINVVVSIQRTETSRRIGELVGRAGAFEPEITSSPTSTLRSYAMSPKAVNLVLFALSRPWP